ncbi:serine protease 55 isoform X2 [Cephus cinctus]|uniref:Serine protease 55 isoform X2 n=1 Tax=Cephus cinctus TaxID=211228 RepID=A0AAJ7BWT2_CEPCN|nr:serine protease 55 isoform X2 [Cephus cinctus]
MDKLSQVSIQDLRGKHMCSGNIIHKDWILTAAHCMYSSEKSLLLKNINVHAGDVRLGEFSEFSQRNEVIKIYVHKYYDNESMENDVALLQLKSSLSLDDLIVSAVRVRNSDVPTSTECSIAGWNVGSPNNQNNDALLYESVAIMQRDVCGAIYYKQSRNSKSMMCAKHVDDNRNTCLADSGAGLICGNGLTGILIRKNCTSIPIPSLYMDIRLYVDWIKEITNLTTSYDGKSFRASMTSTSATSSVNSRNFSPTALGIFLGCLAFLLTFTDHDRTKA